MIRTIWGEKKEISDILEVLAQKYKASGLFWYLYVKANFKYIQENFPNKNNASEARTKAYKAILKSYTMCYNELVSNELYTRKYIPYYQYAVILLKHKLNGMKQMVGKQAVFHTEGMLEQVERLAQRRWWILSDWLIWQEISALKYKVFGDCTEVSAGGN